ncbi:pentatricopeptide repeat-containing protein At4g02820, mitochondrial [Impatiens glandulifera]|uniref:pentatricopeptide repeat-containing protein At4g02820, mitochondrial n=1 Tax=Impatiens glandulifera TaxID=253017 RepID=UPI001FB16C1B|nr:pentatricopeptide repeat-containing protein At4g02820, mitochondrial [Impatiens glandulifera]
MMRSRLTNAPARLFSTAVVSAPKPAATRPSSDKGGGGGSGRDTLGRRLLSLTYAKRSAVITINKWKEEGHTVRKYELNRIVKELRKFKRYKHALEICEWMKVQEDIVLQQGDYAVHLDLISKVRGMSSAEKFFEDLPDKNKNRHACTSLLHTYVQNNESSKAEALMQKMSECGFLINTLPYNTMLSFYISNGQLDKVPQLIQDLKMNTSPDIFTYNLILTACLPQRDVETAEKTLLEIQKAEIEPDWVTYSTLTSLYIKNSLPEKAAATVKEMEKRIARKNRPAYSSLIGLHAKLGNLDEISRIWEKMKSSFVKMSDTEYACMISSLLKHEKSEEAMNLYEEWKSVSTSGNPRIPNLFLADYIKRDQMEEAENFYNKMVESDIKPCYTTWEILTWGYLKQKKSDKVLECFKKALGSVKKWIPEGRITKEVFRNLEEEGDIEAAEQLLVTIGKAGHLSTEIYNSLLRTYASANKMPLIIAERMEKDKIEMNDETKKLIELTSKMCVSEVPTCIS